MDESKAIIFLECHLLEVTATLHIHRSKLCSTLLDGCTSSKVLCMGLLSPIHTKPSPHPPTLQIAAKIPMVGVYPLE
jgi:hypothetical protein